MSLHSMTSYGFGEASDGAYTYTCEIRTLNSRYLEVSARMPRHLMPLEVDLVNHVKTELKRGKVDLFIDCVRSGAAKDLPTLDPEALKHYAAVFAQAEKALKGTPGAGAALTAPNLSLVHLLTLEGVLVGANEKGRAKGADAAEPHRPHLFKAVQGALKAASQARAKEGGSLGTALLELLSQLEAGRKAVAAKHDEILAHLHKGYVKRLEAFLASVAKSGQVVGTSPSDERVLTEVAILADKADIDEELTRLSTHITEFKRLMAAEEGAGRKLDFLCQEMHREVNTMSNKLVQTDVSQHTIEMKQTVERIRQQVQNIE